ncbi:DUF7359 domain-containing protein [Niallia sp. FSL M8-0099]|uniref:DUF7359 domain-containing protein n=1 Tax=Niallia sp. FSL M8-0099 TaxID=2954519 RepID=UPI0030F8F5FF
MLEYYVDHNKKPRKIRLFLLNARGRILSELKDSYNKQQIIRFNDINELSFTVPYIVEIENNYMRNPIIKKFKKKNRIRAVIYNEKHEEIHREEFVVKSKSKSLNDSTNEMNVTCMGRGYELSRFKMRGYEVVSYNCEKVTKDALTGTGWRVSYINPEFNKMYRSFEVSVKSVLEFIIEIAKTFKAKLVYDTNNKTISFYKEEELSKFKGFVLSYENYIQSLDESEDNDEIITRLYVSGADNLTINGVNPTGQSYIDDFSYFYDDMSDSLYNALLLYNDKFEKNKSTLKDLLANKKSKQEELTTLQNKLATLNTELTIIKDNIEIAKRNNESTTNLINQRNAKQLEVNNQKSLISNVNSQINTLNKAIKAITNSLSYQANLNEEQLEELEEYIYYEEWSDSNIDEEQTLYEEGLKYLKENNSPSTNIRTQIVNFFAIVEEQHNWDRFNVGDIIRVECEPVDSYVNATLTEFTIDYESESLDVVISDANKVKPKNDMEKLKKKFTESDQVKNTYYFSRPEINKSVLAFNSRSERNSTEVLSPIFMGSNDSEAGMFSLLSLEDIDDSSNDIAHTLNDDGTVDLTVNWEYEDDLSQIDGFEIFLYSSHLSDDYQFGSTIASEDVKVVDSNKRVLSFKGKSANKYHTFGIRAYRYVDSDINATGRLYSDIVNFPSSPYLPMEQVSMKGNLTGALDGKVNGTTFINSKEEPIDAEVEKTVWIDPATKQIKLKDKNNWVTTSSGDSSSLGGFNPNIENKPLTIPVRDELGVIHADIDGDAKTLNGMSQDEFIFTSEQGVPNGVASLDENGNVPTSNLGNASKFISGFYIGDGTMSRLMELPFSPTLVKIYTTIMNDASLLLPSKDGGFLMSVNGINPYLSGINNSLTLEYGQLTDNGFTTGSDTNTYGNKLDVSYFYEAFYNPTTLINEEVGEING